MSANGGNIQLAIRIKADLDQAKQQLGELAGQTDQVAASATKAGAAARGQAAAITEQTEAARTATAALSEQAATQAALGETEAQAAARIHEMVQASLAAVETTNAQIAGERTLAGAVGQRTAATEAQAAAIKATAAFQAEWLTQTGALAADMRVLESVLSGNVKTTEEIAAAEAALDRLQAQGAVATDELAAAFAVLDKAQKSATVSAEANTAANLENAASKGLNARTTYTISALLEDAATGQFARSKREIGALASETGVLSKLMTPLGAGIGLVVGATALLITAYIKGIEETNQFNAAIRNTGNFAGLTTSQITAMAGDLEIGATSIGKAKDALTALTASGKFTRAEIDDIAVGVVSMSLTTGQSIEDVVKDFEKLKEEPVKAILALNEQYHFLTTAIYEQIQALEDQGKKEEAAALAEHTFSQAQTDRANEQLKNLGFLEHAWIALKLSASDAWDAILGIGRSADANEALQKQYDSVLSSFNQYKRLAGPNPSANEQADLDKLAAQLHTLGEQLRAARDKADQAGKNAQLQQQAVSDLSAEHNFQAATDKSIAKQQALNDLTQRYIRFRQELKANPNDKGLQTALQGVSFDENGLPSGGQFAKDAAALDKKFHGRSATGIDHAQLAADVSAVQNSLKLIGDAYTNGEKTIEAEHKAGLVSDAAYYAAERGMVDVWESDQVAALEQEKTAATAHIVTQQDRIRADQKVAQIDQQITQVHADAAAKRQQIDAQEQAAIQKSQQEWEALKRSFETPAEVRADDALAQIAKLEDALKNVHLTAAQVQQALQQIGEHSVAGALPTYQGVDAAVGGPYGELQKNYQQQAALDAAFHAQKLALDQRFNDQDQAQAVAHQAALLALDKDYASKSAQIQQARGTLQLQTAAGLFGQLATLSSSHNKKVAEIGKAAAIAQAVITTYQNATVAYGEGLVAGGPYAGPVLGAVFAAIAVAAGLANVAAIRAQPTGGYSGGGYTGDGGKNQPAGIVHAGEVVFSQDDIARHGGVQAVEAMRLGMPGYADGGLVGSIGDAPRLSAPAMATPRLAAPVAGNGNGAGGDTTHIHVWSMEEAADRLMSVPAFQKGVIHLVSENPTTIQANWGGG